MENLLDLIYFNICSKNQHFRHWSKHLTDGFSSVLLCGDVTHAYPNSDTSMLAVFSAVQLAAT